MSEICVNCGQEACVDTVCNNVIETAIENAAWGEVGFELPYMFNKVYLCEGPIAIVDMEEKVEVETPDADPEAAE